MRQQTFYISLLFLLIWQLSYGQQLVPTKKLLTELFKENLRTGSKNKGVISSNNEWIICNKDSSFYKSDTIKIYSKNNYYYHSNNCCSFISWTFYNKSSFKQSETLICNEPPISILPFNNLFKTKLKTIDDQLYLLTYNGYSDVIDHTIPV